LHGRRPQRRGHLREAAKGAAAIVCVGTCSAFGGIPFADPNPTGAWPVTAIVGDKPIINVSGCPPIPEVITGTLLQFVSTGELPDLDEHRRPKAFFGNTIHDRCYRRPFYDEGKFAKSFDDEGARNGWCLYELGCKGPTTYNACATIKWNGGTSFPIESGHGCLGCSEPDSGTRAASTPRSRAPNGARRARRTAARAGTGRRRRRRGCRARRGIRRRQPPAPTSQRTRTRPTTNEGRLVMTLLDFARGPALKVAIAIFCLGVGLANRRLRAAAHPPRSEHAAHLGCKYRGGLLAVGSRSWPHREFIGRTGPGEALGYSYHLGLFAVVLLFTPHIIFLGSLFGVTWPGLPSSVITVISVLTMTLVRWRCCFGA
jgi:hypothetical protein